MQHAPRACTRCQTPYSTLRRYPSYLQPRQPAFACVLPESCNFPHEMATRVLLWAGSNGLSVPGGYLAKCGSCTTPITIPYRKKNAPHSPLSTRSGIFINKTPSVCFTFLFHSLTHCAPPRCDLHLCSTSNKVKSSSASLSLASFDSFSSSASASLASSSESDCSSSSVSTSE